MKRRRTVLPGLPENGRADYEEAWDDFLCPQMVNEAIQAEKRFIVSSPSAFVEEVAESVHENDICCVTPLQRLIKMVNEMSPKALSASVSDIDSLVCMTDRVPLSAPLNNSKAAVGADLVGADASTLRRKCSRFGGTIGSRRTRHYQRLIDCEGFDLNSRTIETPDHSHWHGFSLPVKQSLFEEIGRINERLIDSVVSICDKDMITIDPDRSEGIIVKCSFVGMCTHSKLISRQTSALQQLVVHPLKLLVPNGYPNVSPIINEFHGEDCSTGCEDLSLQTREKFNMSVRSLAHPFSISQVARIWDVCARDVVSEYARRNGGGSFSSKYGSWEDCLHSAWS